MLAHLHTHTQRTHINCQLCWPTEIPSFFFGKQRTKGNFYSYAICFCVCVCVCVNIHVCHTQTFTYVYVCGKITIFISDGPRHRLLPTLRIVCAGSLSKANSEIKAHKFILANCWNKRKQASGQWVREPTRYLFILFLSRWVF